MDRKGVDAPSELLCQRRVNPPMALHPRKPGEGGGFDLDPEMSLFFRPGAQVATVEVGFIRDFKPLRGEGRLELAADGGGDAHAPPRGSGGERSVTKWRATCNEAMVSPYSFYGETA